MNRDKTRRILWADDEIDLLKPHIRFLEQKGYAVTPVPSGSDALAALERERYDVLLIDEMMPGMGGLETLDALKQKDVTVPVILITKSEEESLMEEAIGKRITDYLIKPVNPSQVFLACKRVFDAQKLQDSQRARDYVGEMQRWQNLGSTGKGGSSSPWRWRAGTWRWTVRRKPDCSRRTPTSRRA
jgi:DNA-binding NtrC family response regulator